MNNENDLQIIIEENWDNLSEGKEFSKNLDLICEWLNIGKT